MKTTRKILSVMLILCAAGCTAKSNMVFKEKVLETSSDSNKPKWVFQTFKEQKNSFEFSGGVTGVSDYALGVSEARAEAIKNGIVSIQIKARSEFSKFAQGSNMSDDMSGKWVGDGIAFIAESLYVSGIQQKEIYYERVKSNIQYRPNYNI